MIHLLASTLIADAAPVRVLVYSFTVGVNNRTAETALGEYTNVTHNAASDLGTVTVSVVGLGADGGLVVNVAEQGRTNRSVAPATCAIYANTNVICGAAVVTPEETSILRSLNPKFVDPAALDAKGHWRIAPGNGVTIDYTATVHGDDLSISGTRDENSPQTTDHSEMTYTYNPAKVVTTSSHEYQTVRQLSGTQTGLTTIDVTATLTSDSLASKS
jgi:hypothetical protein